MDVPALWRAYGRHAAVMLRAGPSPYQRHAEHSFVVLSGSPHLDMNQAALFGDATQADAARIVDAAERAEARCLLAMSGSLVDRDPLAETLEAGGFVRLSKPEAMFYADDLPAARGGPFVTRRVEGPADHAAMRRIFEVTHGYADEATLTMVGPALLEGTGVEGWLAWDGGVAIAGVFLTTDSDSIGVFDMNTDPAHRRRGAATAVLTHGLTQVGEDSGTGRVLFWSTPFGRPLYESLGFTQVDVVEVWTLGASDEDLASVGSG